eukprot:TRINITY_DN35206_c0_g1_i1.p1 TRINITY_DN35206_c0_g1~~TRINITY_DN35206_c0_g1_i1.p1  ORF type:complete len:446 (+),score=59.29 TRINITY_DN35206_c0_g1_i1:134-1471(+)
MTVPSDLAYDPTWGPKGSDAPSGEPLEGRGTCFCHADRTPLRSRAQSDCEAGKAAAPFGRFFCDSSPALVESALEAAKAAEPAPDFVVVTGDFVAHGVSGSMPVLEHLAKMSQQLLAAFPDSRHIHHPVIDVSLGNNDLEEDYAIDDERAECDQPHLKRVAEIWTPALRLTSEANKTLACYGYFSIDADSQMLISLNTVLYSARKRVPSVVKATPSSGSPNAADPLNQLSWLKQQLEDARTHRKKVYITGHIPPGISTDTGQRPGWKEHFVEAYLDVTREFSQTIAAQLFGHEHMASFKLFPEDVRSPIPLLMAASVAPQGGHVPSFNVVTYDRLTGALLDIDVHQAQADNGMIVDRWKQAYSVRRDLGFPEISASAVKDFAHRLRSNQDLLDFWLDHLVDPKYFASEMRCESSDSSCRLRLICTIEAMRATDFESCVQQHLPTA